jgi:hypothetical protein
MTVNHPRRNISIPLSKTFLHEQGVVTNVSGVFFYCWLF